MKIKDYLSSFIFFLLAAILFSQSRRLPFWGISEPGAGFFPSILCILLGLLSLLIFIKAWLQIKETKETFKIFGPKKGKFLVYCGSFFAFSLIFTKVGYSLSLIGFLVFLLRIIERQSWKITLTIAIASTIVSYVIFRFLQVSIPEGLFSFVIDLLR